MISDAYRNVLKDTHSAYTSWGNGHANLYTNTVLALTPESVLDYGCGKGELVRALRARGVVATGYDPGVPEWEQHPNCGRFDLVTCFDVLEHIEPEHLDAVLADLAAQGERLLATISLIPAKKNLTDGRNAHLVVQPAGWWIEKLQPLWGRVTPLDQTHKELRVLCSR